MKKLLAAIGLTFALGASSVTMTAQAASPAPVRAAVSAKAATCGTTVPDSASDYAAMFNAINDAEWAGADGGINVKRPNGTVVWLYSDTLSTGRFVHNSAIVTYNSCTHVSNGGAQLLPNENSKLIYWIDSVKLIDNNTLNVRAEQVAIGSTNEWDFKSTGIYATAKVVIEADNDLKFVNWISKVQGEPTARQYTKNIIQCAVRNNGVAMSYPTPAQLCPTTNGYKAWSYNPQLVPSAKLASGKRLLLVCFNSDDSLQNPSHYRPKFYEI